MDLDRVGIVRDVDERGIHLAVVVLPHPRLNAVLAVHAPEDHGGQPPLGGVLEGDEHADAAVELRFPGIEAVGVEGETHREVALLVGRVVLDVEAAEVVHDGLKAVGAAERGAHGHGQVSAAGGGGRPRAQVARLEEVGQQGNGNGDLRRGPGR